MGTPASDSEIELLFKEAVARFRAQCLWNITPRSDRDSMALIADKLRQNGGMEAWKLASRIREALARAP